MENYNKLIGSVVGGIVGLVLLFVNNQFGIDLTGVQETVVGVIVTLVSSVLGTFFAPKNVSTEDKQKDAELASLRATVNGV